MFGEGCVVSGLTMCKSRDAILHYAMHGLNIYDVQIHIEFDLTPQAAAIAKERIEASAADIH